MIELEHQCPHCGRSFTMEHQTTFDASDAKALIHGDFHTIECLRCGQNFNIRYPMFYHDAEHKLFCHLGCMGMELGPCLNAEFEKHLKNGLDLTLYDLRECRHFNDFIEKIRIYLFGFHDIPMEYVKHFTRRKAGDGSDGNELRFWKTERNALVFLRWSHDGERLKDWLQHPSVYDLAERTIQKMKKDGCFAEQSGFIQVTEAMWQVFRNKYFEDEKVLNI